jgi:hypothetical protein
MISGSYTWADCGNIGAILVDTLKLPPLFYDPPKKIFELKQRLAFSYFLFSDSMKTIKPEGLFCVPRALSGKT